MYLEYIFLDKNVFSNKGQIGGYIERLESMLGITAVPASLLAEIIQFQYLSQSVAEKDPGFL